MQSARHTRPKSCVFGHSQQCRQEGRQYPIAASFEMDQPGLWIASAMRVARAQSPGDAFLQPFGRAKEIRNWYPAVSERFLYISQPTSGYPTNWTERSGVALPQVCWRISFPKPGSNGVAKKPADALRRLHHQIPERFFDVLVHMRRVRRNDHHVSFADAVRFAAANQLTAVRRYSCCCGG